jgi:predicted dithiol-disulfide oxidoreductase (DUF899 family)
LLDLFEGRRQMIVYRAFAESGVTGWPASEQRLLIGRRPRMGWQMPWYTMTDGLDADFGVAEWHGTNAFIRDGDKIFRTYFVNNRGDEQMGSTWNYLDITALGRQEEWEDSPEGYPQTPPYKWWKWHDVYGETASTKSSKVVDRGLALQGQTVERSAEDRQ